MAADSFLDFTWPVSEEGHIWVIGVPTEVRISRGGVFTPSGYTSDWTFGEDPMPLLVPAEQRSDGTRSISCGEMCQIGHPKKKGRKTLKCGCVPDHDLEK